ncbi:MAG: hypothetical protein PF569_00515 [Candidatus Woesearchaeota archaeon]|jgi:hypothetical protein|nr:hypothetical protein [Candidatus Woesearchaeota archaeon]
MKAARRGLIDRITCIDINQGDETVKYSSSYKHPKSDLRVLKAIIGEQGRDHKDFLYTKLINTSIGTSDDSQRIVFGTDDINKEGFRYYKIGDTFYVENNHAKKPTTLFSNMKSIETHDFEELIREFSEEFFDVFQQDKRLNGYLDTWLKYFKKDFIELGGDILLPKRNLSVNY